MSSHSFQTEKKRCPGEGLRTIIFDLDGTLIDSAPGILDTFRCVLEATGLRPAVPLNNSLIGPPLRRTMMKLTGLDDGDALERLVSEFKRIYDSRGYMGSRVYEGVEELLSEMSYHGIPMAIATNKRRTPTLKILDYLGWSPHFHTVGTLDTLPVPHADKASLIGCVVEELGVDAGSSIYLGDKWEDGEAASAKGVSFIAAGWGYGDWDVVEMPADWQLIRCPYELMARLASLPS